MQKEAARKLGFMQGSIDMELKMQEKIDRLEARIKESSKSTAFSERQIRRLIQLCHPDRHDNSKASNEATIDLIKLLERSKK